MLLSGRTLHASRVARGHATRLGLVREERGKPEAPQGRLGASTFNAVTMRIFDPALRPGPRTRGGAPCDCFGHHDRERRVVPPLGFRLPCRQWDLQLLHGAGSRPNSGACREDLCFRGIDFLCKGSSSGRCRVPAETWEEQLIWHTCRRCSCRSGYRNRVLDRCPVLRSRLWKPRHFLLEPSQERDFFQFAP